MNKVAVVIPAGEGTAIDAMESIRNLTLPVTVLIERGSNPSRNRNQGAAKATEEYIAFTNAHTLLAQDWAAKAVEFFDQHPQIDIVGGPQLNYERDNEFASASGDVLACGFATGAMSTRYKAASIDLDADENSLTSANLVCRRKVLAQVRFDETIYPGEDPKFLAEAKAAGFGIAYFPELIVYNRRRSSPWLLAKQIFHYGRTRVQKEGLKGLSAKPQFAMPMLFTGYLFALPFLLRWPIALVPLAFYLIALAWFSLKLAIQHKEPARFFLYPIIFLIVHCSYGVGFFYGIVRELK